MVVMPSMAVDDGLVDGKTLCSADFDCLLTMDMSEGGLGLTPMQKVRLKREMEAATQR